ncbi:conserved hypothetical protein [Tenacibaculum dicentrarchi]|nr:conserved hypothetical protein [Tenacibaculum dicentrarchi]
MKKMKLVFGILTILMTSQITFGQEYNLEEKTVIGVFKMEGKNKSELFSSINKWISINYNSAQNVIQMNDKEAGTIIIKGINEVVYKNTMKSLYPKNKYIKEYSTTKFNHLIEINIKENKFRIIYKITEIASEDVGFNNMIFNCINFNGNNEKAITEYNEFIDGYLKKGLIGKKKRAKFKSKTKPMFDELNNSIVSDIKLTMKSIEKSVESKKKDDW